MTDNEIIKALECHIKRQCWNDCPNATEERQLLSRPCSQMLAEDALDLINRKDAEIEKLNVELVGLRGACESYKMHYDNAQAEIERLQALVDEMTEVGE